MSEIIQLLLGEIPRDFIRDFGMKKDNELPLVIRLARWALFTFGIFYGVLVLLEKALEVFK